jgi:hypothetical protein
MFHNIKVPHILTWEWHTIVMLVIFALQLHVLILYLIILSHYFISKFSHTQTFNLEVSLLMKFYSHIQIPLKMFIAFLILGSLIPKATKCRSIINHTTTFYLMKGHVLEQNMPQTHWWFRCNAKTLNAKIRIKIELFSSYH